MYWYYMEEGVQVGPLTESEFEDRVRSGRVGPETSVWNEQMTGWQPYGALAKKAPAPPAAMATCSQCGRAFPEQDVIRYENQFVCAACKPLFFQRVREGGIAAGGAVWREGKKLVMDKNAQLPDRCVKCNTPASGMRLKRTLFWHPPAYYILACIGLLLYVIVALLVRKTATIHIGLCAEHFRKRKTGILVAVGLFFLSVALFIIGGVQDLPALLVLGLGLFLGSLIFGIKAAQPVTPARIDDRLVWLNGVCPAYLDQLPPYAG